MKDVLSEIKDAFATHKHLITISGGLEIASVEQIFNGPVTKIMPTIISEVHKGVTLICNNHKVMESEQRVYQIFCKIGQVKIIKEHQFEIAADFTSCAPGLLASICDQFVQAGIKKSDFTDEEASEMLLYTLYGTAQLLQQNNEDFKALINRVVTKGGATEAGVNILEAQLPEIFKEVFNATLGRHKARKEMTLRQFMKK